MERSEKERKKDRNEKKKDQKKYVSTEKVRWKQIDAVGLTLLEFGPSGP